MGRYISGDLEGKCWFGIQPSDFADRFGSTGCQPSYLEYWYSEEHLPQIEEELQKIKAYLGKNLKKLDDFFDSRLGYTDEELQKALGMNENDSRKVLNEYADYKFGIRLRDYVKEHGECQFEVEL